MQTRYNQRMNKVFNSETASHEGAALRGDYSNARDDFSIRQDWSAYTDADHALWRKLFQRQISLMPRYACAEFRAGLDKLDCAEGVPDFDRASERLRAASDWELVAVPGLIPDDAFFKHLAGRRFPVTSWLRKPEEVDYLVEPDVFHDFFGHLPIISDPVFADFLQLYGERGREAEKRGAVKYLARLYWYTVEFGLIRRAGELKAFGAGILSSAGETPYSVEHTDPLRVKFNRERIMRTNYLIDDYQKTYFVIDEFDELFAALDTLDIDAFLKAEAAKPEIGVGQRIETDTLIAPNPARAA